MPYFHQDNPVSLAKVTLGLPGYKWEQNEAQQSKNDGKGKYYVNLAQDNAAVRLSQPAAHSL